MPLIPGGGRMRRRAAVIPSESSVRLLFSDLLAAPKSGWSAAEPNKGAAVTVWHYDLGSPTRGSNYITAGTIDLTGDTDYAEWNVVSYDHPHLFRTTFWLKSTMTDGAGVITLTDGGGTSNGLPFSIITGRIRFVDKDYGSTGTGTLTDPLQNPATAVTSATGGDVVYFRETTTPYSGKYTGGHSNFYMTGQPDGTQAAPIAFVSYPAEVAEFEALVVGTADSCFNNTPEWWTLAKLKMTAYYAAIALGGQGSRSIGNETNGCAVVATGSGVINTASGECDVFGNTVHGGRSNNSLDHAIYISGNPSSVRGCTLAYNYVYDNDFADGPMMVINHQSNRIPAGFNCKEHRIHHNWIDCSNYPSRGIGIYHMGWEVGNPNGEAEPETALVYNNILVECGRSATSQSAMYHVNGRAKWYNNTLIDCHYRAIAAGDTDVISSEWINNICVMADGGYLTIVSGSTSMIVDNNLWYGLGTAPAQDVNAVNSDPDLDANYIPLVGSPAIDAGADTSAVVTDDYYGTTRAIMDIGAVEWQ